MANLGIKPLIFNKISSRHFHTIITYLIIYSGKKYFAKMKHLHFVILNADTAVVPCLYVGVPEIVVCFS